MPQHQYDPTAGLMGRFVPPDKPTPMTHRERLAKREQEHTRQLEIEGRQIAGRAYANLRWELKKFSRTREEVLALIRAAIEECDAITNPAIKADAIANFEKMIEVLPHPK